MFRLRFTSDCHARTKNGQPPHKTTGVARMSSNQVQNRAGANLSSKPPDMAETSTGSAKPILNQNRRVIFASSGLPSSAATWRGSRAMPQMGQAPGSERTICGCIGHVYPEPLRAASTATGSSAIPHVPRSLLPYFRVHRAGVVALASGGWCRSGGGRRDR